MMKVLDRAQGGKSCKARPAKISNEVHKQTMSPCHPLFWGSNSQGVRINKLRLKQAAAILYR